MFDDNMVVKLIQIPSQTIAGAKSQVGFPFQGEIKLRALTLCSAAVAGSFVEEVGKVAGLLSFHCAEMITVEVGETQIEG